MKRSRRTTILLTEELHVRLLQLAKREGTSLGELVRRACERQYRIVTQEDRVKAVEALAKLRLPVSDPRTMERESTLDPEEPLT